MNHLPKSVGIWVGILGLIACSGGVENHPEDGVGGVGGSTPGIGGSPAAGGTSPSGGMAGGNGGSSAGGAGLGGVSAGGTPSVGGATAGGMPSVGGAMAVGGSAGSGGSSTSGGNMGKGGRGGGGRGGDGGAASGGVSGGSAGSAASGAGGGGGGGSTTCGVAPVNPNATPQAKKLLCYLYSQYNNHVLSGQQETSWSNPAADIGWYTSNGMQPPAVLGGDYLYPSGTTARAIAYWNAGGIAMLRYHMGAPPGPDTYEGSMGSVSSLRDVVTAGTALNSSFNSKLDYAAAELKKLQDANVAVLWAPFHEVQPTGWFWWSKGTGAEYIAIWRYMFDRYARAGLNNLVWLLPFSGSPSAAYYPGKAYVDVAGPDTYSTSQPFTSMFNASKAIIGPTVPITLHETGRIPNPNNMFPTAAPWVLFSIWAGYQRDTTKNSMSDIQAIYANAYTVTRNEVPNLK